MTVNLDAGLSSPSDEGLWEFKIDTDGDAREDVSFRLVVIDLAPALWLELNRANRRARTPWRAPRAGPSRSGCARFRMSCPP
jgi:hypothetical protein